MLFSSLSLFVAAAASLASPVSATPVQRDYTVSANTTFPPPTPPVLEFLYRLYCYCPADILDQQIGPLGQRKSIPITGGNITFADGTIGYVRDLGADEGLVDPQTGIFTADTRYHAVIPGKNGANDTDLWFQTSGPKQPDGSLHLRVKIETASKEYYYLNNVVALGVLNNLGRDNNSVSTLRIDAYHMAGEWTNTTFLN